MLFIATSCEIDYGGFNGPVGFLYKSAKDAIKWEGLSVKRYIKLIMKIGRYISLSDERFAKVKNRNNNKNSIADVLISAFGDGKEN